MSGLQADHGLGGAAKQFYERNRIAILAVVLALLGIATGVGTALALLHNTGLRDAALIGGGVALAAVCCVIQTRHVLLGLLAAVAPLPGLIWGVPAGGDEAFGFVPFLAYALAVAVASLSAQTIVERALDGRAGHPWWAAAAAVAMTIALVVLWCWGTALTDAVMQAAIDAALATVSVAVVMLAGAELLRFDEDFVARANRAFERRLRIFEWAAAVTTPRWGLSVSGIALVFLALGWFGAEPVILPLHAVNAGRAALSLALCIAAGGAVSGGWRDAAAIATAALVACLAGLWAIAAHGHADATASVACLEAVAIGTLLAFFAGGRGWAYRRTGEESAVARQRAIEGTGAGQSFAAAAAAVSVLPAVVYHPAYAVSAVALLFALVAGIVFAPAIATALETIMPRQRTIEETYRTERGSPQA